MKIIIASTIVPFIEGGGTFIVDWLEQKLKEYGHEVDVLKIPFSYANKVIPKQMLALRRYHLENVCDYLVCLDLPTCIIQHPCKLAWLSERQSDTLTALLFQNYITQELTVHEQYLYDAGLNGMCDCKKIAVGSTLHKEILSNKLGVVLKENSQIWVNDKENKYEFVRRFFE